MHSSSVKEDTIAAEHQKSFIIAGLRALRGFARETGSREGAKTRNPDERMTILVAP